MDSEKIEKILQEREVELRHEFQIHLEAQINELKERFDNILQNEQIRASCMLREAHRERQEKVSALQTQLQCKNLAALMFVMCTERRHGVIEKHRVMAEFTNYVRSLQALLSEGQEMILHLSRGYKTAAKVDQEWRIKMIKIVNEFQAYIHNFCGGAPETNQYLLNLPPLLKTKVDVYDNTEDPCVVEEEESIKNIEAKDSQLWFEKMGGDSQPFVVFGDMAHLNPAQCKKVLRAVKAKKTAPRRWKNYVFNEAHMRSACPHMDSITEEYERTQSPGALRWECTGIQTDRPTSYMVRLYSSYRHRT
ncbi:hypothetical protein ACJJTC_014196 [Scirpophaga incertulas]